MRLVALFCCLFALPGTSFAEVELSFYGGVQSAPHSRIRGEGGTVDGDSVLIGWEGRSFDAPPYYGIRGTWWQTERLGYGLELTHAKVYAPQNERNAAGYDRLEFTDGLNILTANAFLRFPNVSDRITPYVGAGAGLAIPHVDISKGGARAFEYQITGPAVTVMAGVSYELNDTWSVFGEYKGTYSQNKAELDDGGTIETDIVTNSLNVGVSFRF